MQQVFFYPSIIHYNDGIYYTTCLKLYIFIDLQYTCINTHIVNEDMNMYMLSFADEHIYMQQHIWYIFPILGPIVIKLLHTEFYLFYFFLTF